MAVAMICEASHMLAHGLAAGRAQERKARIERANRMIYEKTDRMKVLKSKLMFTDINAHRARQVEQKKFWQQTM